MPARNEGVTIPVQVRWLSNPQTIRDREQRGEIKPSLVVVIVRWNITANLLVNNGVTAARI